MDNIDWNGSEVPEDATHVRVAGDTYCYYKGITEDGCYFYKRPWLDKWEQGTDFPIGWFEGKLIKRPDTQKITSLLNAKIDLRKEDGTIDDELSEAFQEACFEQGIFWKNHVNPLEYQSGSPFLYVIDGEIRCGLTVSIFKEDKGKQINFKYTRKLEWEATEVDVTPKVDLVDGRAYMFDFNETKDIVGILHSEFKYGSLHRMFCTGNGTNYNSDYATNIKRLVPESIE